MTQTAIPYATAPAIWFWPAAGLGLAWNLFGLWQFGKSLMDTPASLQAMGMTAEQASVMLSYPLWMTVVFAVGVIGGSLGCVLQVFDVHGSGSLRRMRQGDAVILI